MMRVMSIHAAPYLLFQSDILRHAVMVIAVIRTVSIFLKTIQINHGISLHSVTVARLNPVQNEGTNSCVCFVLSWCDYWESSRLLLVGAQTRKDCHEEECDAVPSSAALPSIIPDLPA